LADLPEYINKSELVVTVWNSFMDSQGEVEKDVSGARETVYARIVVDKKKADGTWLYDQLKVLPIASH
ncbi:MAG TPA: hypothetical protein PLJ58_02685, partial [bacterium]|nr:hypothetical protein [bacterium]